MAASSSSAPAEAELPIRDRAATVHDVAERAGVSAQTVSRLLAGYSGIRPATRARVEEALASLDYRPNRAARLLRTRQSTRIGVVVHEMFAHGPARLLLGAAQQARAAGYTLNIVGVDGEDEQAISAVFDSFEEEQVAGILAVTLTDSVRAAVARRRPTVPTLIDPADVHAVGTTMNEDGAALVARHFAELGHRRVGIVLGPEAWLPARQRREGFLRALEGTGVECVRRWEGDWSVASGARAAEDFDPAEGVTAVFAVNDGEAIGFAHGLLRRGIRVPEDVAVAGFDATPESGFLVPALTTVEADYEGEGRSAIDALLSLIDGAGVVAPSVPHVQLLARDSTTGGALR